MADKLKKGISVVPEFVAGEQPPAEKFTAIAAQAKHAVEAVEYAVGDIHDESYPYAVGITERLNVPWFTGVGGERFLGIVNLGRLIGPAANLNPRELAATTITETVPTGVYSFVLRYPPDSAPVFSDATVFATAEPIADMLDPGDYCVVGSEVFTISSMAGGTVTYDIDPSTWYGGGSYVDSTFNVIPDPNQTQTGAYKLTVTGPVDGVYTVMLPQVSGQQSNEDLDSVDLTAEDANFDQQLTLPRVIVDNYASGDILPTGFVLLRDNTTNTVYDDAVYRYVDEQTIEVSEVDLDDEIGDDDDFCLLTVGTDVTTSIDDLRIKMKQHSHDRRFGESTVDFEDITGATKEAGGSGPWTASEIPGNYLPQYLHRDGYDAVSDVGNINDANIMRGHLVLGSTTEAAGAKYSLTGASYSIAFGTVAGPTLSKNANNDLLIGGVNGKRIINDTEVEVEEGVVASGEVSVTTPFYNNTAIYAKGTGGITNDPLNIGANWGAVYANHGIVAGPFNDDSNPLNKWEITPDGTGAGSFSTPLGVWAVPRFQVIHSAFENVEFEGREILTGNSVNTAADVDYWEYSLGLPDYITYQHVIGVHVLIRGPGSSQWRGPGLDPRDDSNENASSQQQPAGENITWFIDSSTNPDTLVIRVGAGGADATENAFYGGAGSDGTPATIEVDYKITLMIAAPENEVL